MNKIYNFSPCNLEGRIELPPSKSYLHRYIICSSLSKKCVELNNVTEICEDVATTLKVFKNLLNIYYKHDKKNNKIIIYNENKKINKKIFHMNNSASSLRMILPIILFYTKESYIYLGKSLNKRSIKTYENIFKNVVFKKKNNLLIVKGTVKNNFFNFNEKVSSQFISGLLFLFPLLNKDSQIKLKNTPPSLGYIKMTIKALADFNIKINHNNKYTYFKFLSNQNFNPLKKSYNIEIDHSSKCFWDIANKINNKNNIRFSNYNFKNSLQPDFKINNFLINNNNVIDVNSCPDLFPILSLYLLSTNGGILLNIKRLKYKESNRLNAIIEILRKSNIKFLLNNNNLIIFPGILKNYIYNTYGDHRIAMSLIIYSSFNKNSIICINEINSIKKSYVNFLKHFNLLKKV